MFYVWRMFSSSGIEGMFLSAFLVIILLSIIMVVIERDNLKKTRKRCIELYNKKLISKNYFDYIMGYKYYIDCPNNQQVNVNNGYQNNNYLYTNLNQQQPQYNSNQQQRQASVNQKQAYSYSSSNQKNYYTNMNYCRSRNEERTINKSKSIKSSMALILGVLFISFSGFIFATTTWNLLPPIAKVFLIVSMTALFFVASYVAENKLFIYKTSKAFYILGSIFTFVGALSLGYFKIFGARLSLTGEGAYTIVTLGLGATLVSLIIGVRKFSSTIYNLCTYCFMTFTMMSFCKALGFTSFCIVGLISIIGVLQLLVNLLLKNMDLSGMLSDYELFSVCNLGLIAVFDIMNVGNVNKLSSFCFTIASALLLVDFIYLSLTRRKTMYISFTSIAAVAFLFCAGFFINLKLSWTIVITVLVICIVSGIFSITKSILKNGFCSFVYFFVASSYVFVYGCITCFSSTSIERSWWFMVISLAVLILLYIESLQYKFVECMFPVTTIVETFPLYILLNTYVRGISYCPILFIYFVVFILFDLLLNKKYKNYINVIGVVLPIIMFIVSEKYLPFSIILVVYLLIKTKIIDKSYLASDCYEILGNILLGTFLLMFSLTHMIVLATLVPGILIVGLYLYILIKNDDRVKKFIPISGCILYIIMMVNIYIDGSQMYGLIIAIPFFVFVYMISYYSNKKIIGLIECIFLIGVPALFIARCNLTIDSACIIIIFVQIVSIVVTKFFYNIIEIDYNSVKYDWFNMISPVFLLYLLASVNNKLVCAAFFMMAIYTLQYYFVKGNFDKSVIVLISEVLLAISYWIQPFVKISNAWYVKVNLIPIVAIGFSITYLWKKSKNAIWTQTFIYCGCIVFLLLDALDSQRIIDVLLVCVICVIIFTVACIINSAKWIKISSIFLIIQLIYWTRNFWFNIKWWVYLLLVGIGFIVFAAINEKKKNN